MGKYEKLILKILSGQSDTNIPFDDLCNLLQGAGFVMRIRGSHHVFRKRESKRRSICNVKATTLNHIKSGKCDMLY